MFRLGCELLFGIGQDALGRRRADAGARIGLHGFDLRKNLLLRLAHLDHLLGCKAHTDYAILCSQGQHTGRRSEVTVPDPQ